MIISIFFPHREQKDPVYLRDKVSQKHSKEQFESAQKIEQEYSKFFTGLNETTWTTDNQPFVCLQYKCLSVSVWTVIKTLCFLFVAGIVQGGTLPYICTQIMTIVDQEQSKVLWTPLGCP